MHKVRSKKVCEDSQAICKTSVAFHLEKHGYKLHESVVMNRSGELVKINFNALTSFSEPR